MPHKKTVFVIVGPTSTGKTSLALTLCKKFGGEVISADSRQVYKYMDIGTGKIPIVSGSGSCRLRIPNKCPRDAAVLFGNPLRRHPSQRRAWIVDGVSVWGYDLVTPDQYFSAYDYARFALSKAKELQEQDKQVFLVGGTGFYIDFVTGYVQPSLTRPDFSLRKELEDMSVNELYAKVTSLNLVGNLNISDRNNKRRLIRLIEKTAAVKNPVVPLPYLSDTDFVFVGLTAVRKVLYAKVDAWLDAIWKGGLLDEVKRLLDMGFKGSHKMHGLIYKTAVDFLNGTVLEAEAIQRAKFDLHAYVRRQQTYFKKNKDIVWLDIQKAGFEQDLYRLLRL